MRFVISSHSQTLTMTEKTNKSILRLVHVTAVKRACRELMMLPLDTFFAFGKKPFSCRGHLLASDVKQSIIIAFYRHLSVGPSVFSKNTDQRSPKKANKALFSLVTKNDSLNLRTETSPHRHRPRSQDCHQSPHDSSCR